MAFEILIST